MKKIMFILILSIFLFSFVSAVQPTQQTNKINLDPFYIPSVTKNINYTFSGYVSAPDRISSVSSAQVMFHTYATAGTVRLFVNNQSCRNPTFYLGYSGYTDIIFECSNVITQEGNYTFKLSADKDMGSVVSWIDLTYMNNPFGSLNVKGTEYIANDYGKIFLQLLDSSSQPLTNSTCYSSIYYPDNSVYKYKQLMTYVDEGLYSYDFIVPYISGVYMVAGYCTIPALLGQTKKIADNFESGNTSGGTGWSNNWDISGCVISTDNPHTGTYNLLCTNDQTPSRKFLGNSTFTELDYTFWWRSSSLASGEIVYYKLYDASGIATTLLTVVDGMDDGVWRQATGSLYSPARNLSGNMTLRIETSGNLGGNSKYRIDDINMTLRQETSPNSTAYQIIRGSGEVHISNPESKNYISVLDYGELTNKSFTEDFTFHYAVTSQSQANLTAQKIEFTLYSPFPCDTILDVGDRTNGTLIYYNYTSKVDVDGRCVIGIEHNLNAGQAYDIEIRSENYWKIRTYEDYSLKLLQEQLINVTCQNYITQQNLTNITIPISSIPYGQDALWLSCASYLDRAYAFNEIISPFLAISNVNANFTIEQMDSLDGQWSRLQNIQKVLWEYSNTIFNSVNLADAYALGLDPYSGVLTNPTWASYFANISASYQNYIAIHGVPNATWNYTNRTLTSFNFTVNTTVNNTAIAQAVWNYNNRSLTEFTFPIFDYSLMSQFVWNNSNRNLTYFPAMNNITVGDIWNYANRNLTWFPTQNNITTQDIWTYYNRTLTYYPTPNNLTADDVWAYVNRNLTYFPTENNITPYDVWSYFNRSLTEFNFDVVNETAVAEAVWSWNGLISNNILSQFAQYIWNWTGTIASQIGDFIATTVWNAPARNLTHTDDVTDYQKVSDFVWNNSNRNLTYFPTQQDLTNYSLIAESVWLYNSRNLTYFPVQQDLTNYSNIAQQVWIYNNRNLTYFPAQVDLTNYTLITENVWSYLNRTLTDYNQSDLTNYTKITEDVWTYLYRNLTYTEDVTNYSQISGDVWNYVNRNLTFYNNTQQVDLTNYTKIVEDVWTYLNRNLTYYEDVTNYTQLANDVWAYNNRTLTYYPIQVDLTNYTQIIEGVWSHFNRTLTDYNQTAQVDLTNYSLIVNDVWSYFNRTLTDYNSTAQQDLTNYTKVVEDVWAYMNRTLTDYNSTQQVDLTNYTLISDNVWSYVNRSLTYYQDVANYSQISQDVWTYVNRSLTEYNSTAQQDLTNYSLIASDVWNYINRTLTDYNSTQQVDLTNYTKIVEDAWNYANRTLTYYNNTQQVDLTNYTQLFDGVWQYANRSLTEFNFTVNANVNITQIAEGVWYYSDRNLTYFPAPVINNLTASDVWNYVNRTLTYYPLPNNLTAGDIWNYINRTLTYYLPANNITAEEIWNFVSRNLTYIPDVTNYTLINQGVWNYSNRTLVFDYGNGVTTSQTGSGKLPLTTIQIVTPDPLYFDETYTFYYDPVNLKGETVEVKEVEVAILENITYTKTTPYLMTDGRYKQDITIPLQDISSLTLSVNMSQNFIVTNQKAFLIPEEKKTGGITGFVTIDNTTKKNLLYLLLILIFLVFLFIIVGVVSKSNKEKRSKFSNRY